MIGGMRVIRVLCGDDGRCKHTPRAHNHMMARCHTSALLEMPPAVTVVAERSDLGFCSLLW
jgi:hypothetical protein